MNQDRKYSMGLDVRKMFSLTQHKEDESSKGSKRIGLMWQGDDCVTGFRKTAWRRKQTG